ncbi:MAG: MBL fold metallo-hydrolase [Gammaproteobacteria bacterium]|jgi:glyoxylase-like metal-dependent hydrolase (beta-lactamase superfamily II)|nr:MBL fold metallo-hydrolase [Gammaproteobacteria bacterium]
MNDRAPVVHPFRHAGTGTWSYVVADAATGRAAVIDPVLDFDIASARTSTASAQALVDCVQAGGYGVDWLLETHAHADHLSAAQWLKQVHWPDARVAIGEGIRSVQARFRDVFDLGPDFPVDGSQFDHLFGADDAFAIGGIACRAIPVPGHTSDSCAYLVGDALFVGDSLFMPDAGTARCDFPGGDAATLYRSIRRLFAELPDATRVFVCHDYGPGGREPACETTIGAQKRDNIHVRVGLDEAGFVATREARDASLAMPALIIPSVQVNIRGGALPDPHANGLRYLEFPLDAL